MEFEWQTWMVAIVAPLGVLAAGAIARAIIHFIYVWKASAWWDAVLSKTYNAMACRAEKAQRDQLEADWVEMEALSHGTGMIPVEPPLSIPPHLIAIRKRLDAILLEIEMGTHLTQVMATYSIPQIVALWLWKARKPVGALSIGETRRVLDPSAQATEGKTADLDADSTIAGSSDTTPAPHPGDALIAILRTTEVLERLAALAAMGYLTPQEFAILKQDLLSDGKNVDVPNAK